LLPEDGEVVDFVCDLATLELFNQSL